MTSSHFIFIPAVLIVGMFIGFLLGSRVAQDRLNLELKRQTERDEAFRKRAERKAGQAAKAETGQGAAAGQGAAGQGDAAPKPTGQADTVKSKKAPPR